jgi:hypothetical protein
MLLSNPNTLVAKQNGNSFNGHAGEEQFNRKCIAKAMRMSFWYVR